MDPIRRCVQALSRLPGIGEKTAWRLTWWLLRADDSIVTEIAAAVGGLQGSVVERPQDIQAIESSGEYRGLFHVLHGSISPLDGVGPDQLRIRPLLANLGQVKEVIVATDPDVEGDATALYLHRVLKPLGIQVSRLAYGVSVGTEIEYADKVSLMRALENRRLL